MNVFVWILISSFGLILLGLPVIIIRFKLARLDMTFFEFARRLLTGGGYQFFNFWQVL